MSATTHRSSTAADALGLRRLSQITSATEGSNALSLPEWSAASPSLGSPPGGPAVLSLVPIESAIGGSRPDRAPQQTPQPDSISDPALHEQAHGLAQALVEILAGDRTLTQLVRWTSAEVYEQLHHRVATLASCPRPSASDSAAAELRPRRRRPRVASVHVSTPTEGIAEVSARIDHGVRSTAIAMRLEQRSAGRRVSVAGAVRRVGEERWMCTAVTWA